MSGLGDEELAVRAYMKCAQTTWVKGKVDSDLLIRALRYAIERSRRSSPCEKPHDKLE